VTGFRRTARLAGGARGPGLAVALSLALLLAGCRAPVPEEGKYPPPPVDLTLADVSPLERTIFDHFHDVPLRPYRAHDVNVERLQAEYLPAYSPLTYRAPGIDDERHRQIIDLLELLRRDLTRRRWQAERELAGFGELASPYARQLLTDARSHVRCSAVRLLADHGPPDYIPDIIDRLQDRSIDVRLCAYTRLQRRTGQRFPYRTTAPKEERRVAVEQWITWFAATYPAIARRLVLKDEQERRKARAAAARIREVTPPPAGDARVPPQGRMPTVIKTDIPEKPGVAPVTPHIATPPIGLREENLP